MEPEHTDAATAKPKPALVVDKDKKKKKGKTHDLTWDEEVIEEHDKLRGTRMKIEEPNTPYAHHYDSGSETDGSHASHKAHKDQAIKWDNLQTRLDSVAAVQQQNTTSIDQDDDEELDEEEKAKRELKALEFKEHRKRHYNEMELVRKFRQEHANDDDDEENDADDEN